MCSVNSIPPLKPVVMFVYRVCNTVFVDAFCLVAAGTVIVYWLIWSPIILQCSHFSLCVCVCANVCRYRSVILPDLPKISETKKNLTHTTLHFLNTFVSIQTNHMVIWKIIKDKPFNRVLGNNSVLQWHITQDKCCLLCDVSATVIFFLLSVFKQQFLLAKPNDIA